jgi:hypothetical protein
MREADVAALISELREVEEGSRAEEEVEELRAQYERQIQVSLPCRRRPLVLHPTRISLAASHAPLISRHRSRPAKLRLCVIS